MNNTLTKPVPAWVEQYLSYFVGGVFACAALVFFVLLSSIFVHHYAARSWIAVPAQVLSAEIRESRSGSFTRPTFNAKLHATYQYSVSGKKYTGSTVDFGFGSDNFSDKRRARQMNMLRGPALVVFVNPNDPEHSVLDRSLPIEQVNFTIIFLFFPCGLGTVLLLSIFTSGFSRIGWKLPERLFGPLYGMLHSLPGLYAPLYAPRDIGPFGWIIVTIAICVMLISIRTAWHRIRKPDNSAPGINGGLIRFR